MQKRGGGECLWGCFPPTLLKNYFIVKQAETGGGARKLKRRKESKRSRRLQYGIWYLHPQKWQVSLFYIFKSAFMVSWIIFIQSWILWNIIEKISSTHSVHSKVSGSFYCLSHYIHKVVPSFKDRHVRLIATRGGLNIQDRSKV